MYVFRKAKSVQSSKRCSTIKKERTSGPPLTSVDLSLSNFDYLNYLLKFFSNFFHIINHFNGFQSQSRHSNSMLTTIQPLLKCAESVASLQPFLRCNQTESSIKHFFTSSSHANRFSSDSL